MATFTCWLLFLAICVDGLIDSSGGIDKEYKLNTGMSLKEISDAYLREFYERMEEFRRKRTYKEDFIEKSESLVNGWLPLPPPPPEREWSPINVNDFVENGNKVENSFAKRNKFSTLPYNQPSKLESKSSDHEIEVFNTTLHSLHKPFVNFTLTSNRTMYEFEVRNEMGREYLISVAVEKMNCLAGRNNSAKLFIVGEHNKSYLCKDIDDGGDQFQWVSHVVYGNAFVKVMGKGDWEAFGVSATLVASIYHETPSCRECEKNGHFCCGREDSCSEISDGGKRFSKSMYQDQFRCIPRKDNNGSSMLCNGHPNCGFHCNLDELKKNCPKKEGSNNEDDNYCPGYYCRTYGQDRFLVTILLLILFCVILPFCIFLFLCGRRDLRRNCETGGRCPLPLEILFCPFSMSADSVSEEATTRSGHGSTDNQQGRRQQRGRERARRSYEVHPSGSDNFSFFDDLPPSYSEFLSNKEMYPNPTRLTDQSSNPSSRRIDMPTKFIPPSTVTVAPTTSSERFPLEQIVRTHSHEDISPHGRPIRAAAEQSPSDTETDVAAAVPDSSLQDRTTKHICQCRRHQNPVLEGE